MPRTYAWIITDDHLGDDERVVAALIRMWSFR